MSAKTHGGTQGRGPGEQLSGSSDVESSVDTQLMLKVRKGDQSAFKRLYEKFKGPIMSYVFTLGRNQAAAEEISQDVFLKLYRVRETYRPEAKFSTWLWTLARHTSLDYLRKKRETHFDDPADSVYDGTGNFLDNVEASTANAEAQLLENAERVRIDDCMEALSLSQKEALTLRTVSELSYDEISKMMGSSLASVKSLIFRAKNSLMDCLRGGKCIVNLIFSRLCGKGSK